MSDEFAEAQEVCVFEHEPGKDPYDEVALDRVVENFSGEGVNGRIRERLGLELNNPLVHIPDEALPYGIGHEEIQKQLQDSGIPAAGWIHRVWRRGRRLYAHIKDIPEVVADLIKTKQYRARSAEIYKDFEGLGPALRRVVLLGGDIPAKKTLGEMALQTYAEGDLEYTLTYYSETSEMNEKEINELKEKYAILETANKEKEAELAALKEQIASLENAEKENATHEEKFAEMRKQIDALTQVADSRKTRLDEIVSKFREADLDARIEKLARDKNIFNEDLKKQWRETALALPEEHWDRFFETLTSSVQRTVEIGKSKVVTEGATTTEEAADRAEYEAWNERSNHTDAEREKFTYEWWQKAVAKKK